MKNKNTYVPVIISIISIILGYISSKHNITGILYIAVIIPFIFSLFMNSEQNFMTFCLLLASNRLLTINSISILLLLMISGLAKFKNKLKIPLIFLIITFCLILIPLFYSSKIIVNILLIIKIVIMLLYFYNILYTIKIDSLKKDYVNYIFWGIFITFIFSIIINPSIIMENSRFALTDAGGENILGILCGVEAIMIICNLITKVKINNSIIKIIILLLIGFMTGSRSFLLVIAFGLAFIAIYELLHGNIKTIMKIAILLITLSCILYISIKYLSFLNNFYNKLVYRIQKLSNNDLSNGRYELWRSYINVFKNNKFSLLFGYPNYEDYGIKFVAHNFLIEQIATNGIIGSTLIGILYIKTIKHITKKERMVINVYSSILISFIVVSMVSHSWFGIFQTTIIMLSILFSTRSKEIG